MSTFDVERYKKARREAGAADGTINRELAVLSHLLNKAIEWRWIDSTPVKIRRLKEENGRITYLTEQQATRLVDAARHDRNLQMLLFSMNGLETSMRRMEILSIRLEDIDFERRMIYVPKAKAGPREQPITAGLATELRRELGQAEKGQEWLFPSKRSRTGHSMWPENSFRRVANSAGLDPREITPHVLRHTAITHLVQEGVDLPTVQRISRHKTLAMVARYSHQNGDHIRAARDKLENRYREATDNPGDEDDEGDTVSDQKERFRA